MATTKCDGQKLPPKIAEFFHSFHHVNLNFDIISSTFEPTDTDYQQNLLLYSSVPVLFGSVLFLIFTISVLSYCCLCCHKLRKKQIRKKRTKRLCSICLALLICLSSLISSGSIIAGFVFNENIDSGVETVTMAIKNVSGTFDDVQNRVSEVQNNMLDVRSSIGKIIDSPDIPEEVKDILNEMQKYVLSIIQSLRSVKTKQAPDIDDYIETGEYYRWLATIGILGLGILTCLFAIYSSIRQSRCGFAMTTLLGCLVFLLDWVLLGSHLAAAIAMSDLCINPRKTIDFYTSQSSPPVKEIVNYYVECKPNTEHPYDQYIRESLGLVHKGVQMIKELEERWSTKRVEMEAIAKDFNATKASLIRVQEELNCSGFQQQYEKARCAVCFPVVGGLSKLLLMSAILVVLFAVILLLIIPMCKRIHRKKKRGNAVVSVLNGGESMETEYHSVTTDDESLPLLPNAPPPPYEAVARTSPDFQFHSCEDGRNPSNSSIQPPQNHPSNTAPPPPRGEIVHNPRKVTIMAF